MFEEFFMALMAKCTLSFFNTDPEVMYKDKFNVLEPRGKFPTMHL
jgi:hypothetical protein